MKQLVLVALVSLFSVSASASTFQKVQVPSNASLAKLARSAKSIEGAYVGTYRVLKQTDPRGRKPEEARLAVIKEAMHRYMCSFFDESIDLGRATGARAVDTVVSDLDLRNNGGDDESKIKAVERDLGPVVSDRALEVYSGSASGNNTSGSIMGVYDTKANEVMYFGFTNCGSDD